MGDLYLDSTATTKPTELAINTFVNVNTNNWHNPNATMSEGGIAARRLIEQSREKVAELIGAKPEQIIFTSGATEGANMIIQGFIPRGREKNYSIICSPIEHPAVWKTVQYMKLCGVDVKILGVNEYGEVDLKQLNEYLRQTPFNKEVLVCIMDSNNEIGTIQRTMEIEEIVHSYPSAYMFSDMTQSYAHADIIGADVLGYDFACASAQKFGGLKGVGFVYARYPKLLVPLIHGGGQECGMRSGTENVGGIFSMAHQFDMVCNARDRGDNDYIRTIRKKLIDKLMMTFSDCRIISPEDGLANIVSVCFPRHDANQIVTMLELQGIQVSAGSACHTGENEPSRVLKAIGLTDDQARSTIRISLSSEVSRTDIDRFVNALKGVM